MRDFIIAIVVTALVNAYIIERFWNPLRQVWIYEQGSTLEQTSIQYGLLCVASYLCVGLVAYAFIWLVKKGTSL